VNAFYLDASAAGKRYAPEPGTPIVNHLFVIVAPDRCWLLTQAIGEVTSLLVRKKNQGQIPVEAYQAASRAMRLELPAFRLIRTDDALVFESLELIERHSINSTDALVLRSAWLLARDLRDTGDDLVFVASDARLLRAASTEGLTTFDPETDTVDRLQTLIEAT
jgi:predicted nucleic acid-binding protein